MLLSGRICFLVWRGLWSKVTLYEFMVYPCTHPSYIERSCPAFNAAEALTAFGASHPLSEIGGAMLVLGHRESFFPSHLLICFFSMWICMHVPVTIRWQLAGVILSFSHVGSELRPSGLVISIYSLSRLAGWQRESWDARTCLAQVPPSSCGGESLPSTLVFRHVLSVSWPMACLWVLVSHNV